MPSPKSLLRILTINRHEIYLSMLAMTGHKFEVLEQIGKDNLIWNKQCGAPPENIKLIKWNDEINQNLKVGSYDYIICHTIKDLFHFWKYKNNKFIFVIHIALYSHSLFFKFKWLIKRLTLEIFKRTRSCQIVAVSEFKKNSWRIDYHAPFVIRLATLPVNQSTHLNSKARIIAVGNHFARRKEMNYELLKTLKSKFPITVVGQNPEINNAIICTSRQQYLEELAKHDIFVFTTPHPWNDGYNTATLEAMAAGLAIASLSHPSSPIIHGEGGILAKDSLDLIEKLQKLIDNIDLIKKMGENNKKTINQFFDLESFIKQWNTILSGSND